MAYSNGKITGAVSINDVQRALGVSSDDAATLCTSNKINKWAKYKPVHYGGEERKLGRLTVTDYRVQNINAGQHSGKTTYYGLQIVTLPDVLDTHIHDNDYLYIGGPAGTESSPYRLQDFAGPSGVAYGYDINAVPNLSGYGFNSSPSAANTIPICARVDFEAGNTTGVNVFELTGNGYSDSSTFKPNAFYVCAMLTSSTHSWWRVLYRSSSQPVETDTPPSGTANSPLSDNTNLNSDFSNWFYSAAPSNISGNFKVTFFLAATNTTPSSAKEGWVTYEGETVHYSNPIPIPKLIGLDLTIQSHDPGYTVELSNVGINRDTFVVTAMGSTMTKGSESAYTAILTVPRISSSIPNGTIGTWTTRAPYSFPVTWQLPVASMSGTYTYTITIKYNNVSVGTTSGEWNFD